MGLLVGAEVALRGVGAVAVRVVAEESLRAIGHVGVYTAAVDTGNDVVAAAGGGRRRRTQVPRAERRRRGECIQALRTRIITGDRSN